MFEDSNSRAKGASFGNQEKILQTNFSPRDYLATYYPPLERYRSQSRTAEEVIEENISILRFYAQEVVAKIKTLTFPVRVLEVGGGPTIYQLISLSAAVEEIVFTDYLLSNLEAVSRWINSTDTTWDTYITESLFQEGRKIVSQEDINSRKHTLKSKIKRLCRYDAVKDLGLDSEEKFMVVCSNFCFECISEQRTIWQQALSNAFRKILTQGVLVMTVLKGSQSYRIGKESLGAVFLGPEDVKQELGNFGFKEINIFTRNSSGNNGYDGIMYVIATKE